MCCFPVTDMMFPAEFPDSVYCFGRMGRAVFFINQNQFMVFFYGIDAFFQARKNGVIKILGQVIHLTVLRLTHIDDQQFICIDFFQNRVNTLVVDVHHNIHAVSSQTILNELLKDFRVIVVKKQIDRIRFR